MPLMIVCRCSIHFPLPKIFTNFQRLKLAPGSPAMSINCLEKFSIGLLCPAAGKGHVVCLTCFLTAFILNLTAKHQSQEIFEVSMLQSLIDKCLKCTGCLDLLQRMQVVKLEPHSTYGIQMLCP